MRQVMMEDHVDTEGAQRAERHEAGAEISNPNVTERSRLTTLTFMAR